MPKELFKQLNHVRTQAIKHRKAPDELINAVTEICKFSFDVTQLYSERGIITNQGALNLLNNNIIAATRQHDLGDAEAFRERKSSMNAVNRYFVETIHGCHTAPTFTPVTFQTVLEIINRIEKDFQN